MHLCCPAGHGCNAPNNGEPCALEVFRVVADWQSDASVALVRWEELNRSIEQGCGESEQRFRRRAYQRARDRALIAQAMDALPSPSCRPARAPTARPPSRQPNGRSRKRGARKPPSATGSVAPRNRS
jgi:hypothetical protein